MSLIGFWNSLFKRDRVAVDSAIPHNDVSVWINSRGVGMDVCGTLTVDYNPVTREEFDAYLKGGKIDDLKSEIQRNRRNKKKSSHLVAELMELENGK